MKTRSQRAYVYFAVIMAFIMVASVIFPVLLQGSQQPVISEQAPPTAIPAPTLPPALTDFSGISFDETYLHPSGLFTVAVPTGWTISNPSNNGSQVQVNMRNAETLSVIETYVDVPTVNITTLQDLDQYFDSTMLGAGWRSYSDWREIGRTLDEANNRLQIDFELTQARQTYLARHLAWTDGDWIYVTRIITTTNMRDLLLFLVDEMPPTLQPNKLFAETPVVWNVFHNPVAGEVIRYPSSWIVDDGVAGFPVSVAGTGGERLRIDVPVEAVIADEAEASAYIAQIRPGVTVNSVQPTERNGATGFTVSYNSTTLEGEGTSGLGVLLNGEDGLLHVATLSIPVADVDLNAVGDDANITAIDAAKVLSSFHLTQGLALPTPESTETEDSAS